MILSRVVPFCVKNGIAEQQKRCPRNIVKKYILAAEKAAERRILHYGFCFLADSSTSCTYYT